MADNRVLDEGKDHHTIAEDRLRMRECFAIDCECRTMEGAAT